MPLDTIDAEAMQRSVEVANAVIRARSHRDRAKIAGALVLFATTICEDDRDASKYLCDVLRGFLCELDDDLRLALRHQR